MDDYTKEYKKKVAKIVYTDYKTVHPGLYCFTIEFTDGIRGRIEDYRKRAIIYWYNQWKKYGVNPEPIPQ